MHSHLLFEAFWFHGLDFFLKGLNNNYVHKKDFENACAANLAFSGDISAATDTLANADLISSVQAFTFRTDGCKTVYKSV